MAWGDAIDLLYEKNQYFLSLVLALDSRGMLLGRQERPCIRTDVEGHTEACNRGRY